MKKDLIILAVLIGTIITAMIPNPDFWSLVTLVRIICYGTCFTVLDSLLELKIK